MQVSKEGSTGTEAYQQGLTLMRRCLTPDGFVATPIDKDNYARVWTRDGVLCGLAALTTGDSQLIKGMEHTLDTIATYQGKHGEIPSNVSRDGKEVSYGRLTGRVDAVLWYIIGVCAYVNYTRSSSRKERYWLSVERAINLVECWEYNDRGLLYTPLSGNWADEYVQQGYVLADLLLYYIALSSAGQVFNHKDWRKEAVVLKKMLEINYWPLAEFAEDEHIYHYYAYKDQVERGAIEHWLPAFSQAGYVNYFDGLAHALALINDLGDSKQRVMCEQYIGQLEQEVGSPLLPAFWPIIKPGDPQWKELETNHLYAEIKNQPYMYHNGGLWPMVTGLYILGLVRRGQQEQAQRLLVALDAANAQGREGRTWEFAEYHHGQTHEPMGMYHQAWSAAAGILAHQAVWNNSIPWPF